MRSELYRLWPIALEHVLYLNQVSTLFWETQVVRYELVGVSQDSADDCGLGQAGEQLLVKTKYNDGESFSRSARTKKIPNKKSNKPEPLR